MSLIQWQLWDIGAQLQELSNVLQHPGLENISVTEDGLRLTGFPIPRDPLPVDTLAQVKDLLENLEILQREQSQTREGLELEGLGEFLPPDSDNQ